MNLASIHPKPQTERYLALLDRYERFVTDAGKTVRRSTPEEARILFEGTGEAHQKTLVARLEVEISIFEETLAAGERLTDSRRLLWRHFARSGYVPCSDLFDKIQDNDVIEVFGLDQIHLFQNLNFFDWVSFTLEQLFSHAWFKLVRRDASIYGILSETARRIVTGEVRHTADPGVPWHLVEEIDTELLKKFYFKVKYVSPVYSGGQLCCFVAVDECKPA